MGAIAKAQVAGFYVQIAAEDQPQKPMRHDKVVLVPPEIKTLSPYPFVSVQALL